MRNGIFFSDHQASPSDHPNADFSFEAFNGTRLLGDYSGADFSGATFSNRGIDLAVLAGTFTNANFSEAVFDGVVINPNNASSFYGANFSGAVFDDVWNGEGATYYTSTFSNLVAGLVYKLYFNSCCYPSQMVIMEIQFTILPITNFFNALRSNP